jgi:hypothetical protein
VLLGVVDRRWFAARERWRQPEHERCEELLNALAELGVTALDASESAVVAYEDGESGISWLGRESLRAADAYPLLGALERLQPKVAARL